MFVRTMLSVCFFGKGRNLIVSQSNFAYIEDEDKDKIGCHLRNLMHAPCISILPVSSPMCLLPLKCNQIAQELQHNPFMRVEEKAVLMATGAGDGVDAMKRLREMKNKFRPPPETPGRFPGL